MATGVPVGLTAQEGRRFGFTVGSAFLVIAALMWWRGRILGFLVLVLLGSLLLLAGLAVPGKLGPVYGAWMGFATLLSKVTTPIFMGAVYFLVLTPLGVVLRLLGKNPLRPPDPPETVWTQRQPDQRRSDLLRQF